jgi:Anti-sigma-K factor rskA
MLSDRDIELAHPEAFDFAFGNLPADRQASFNRHLSGCRYCRNVVDEYGGIGSVIKILPPHAEPSAELEDRTVAAMIAVLAGRRAEPATGSAGESTEDDATRSYPVPKVHRAAEPETRVQPRPPLQPAAELQAKVQPIPQLGPPDGPEGRPGSSPAGQPAPTQTAARPMVTRLPAWRRYRGRLTAVVAVAAAIITAAIVLPLSLGGGRITPAQATAVIPLHATTTARLDGYGAATGRATARQNASGSWTISLTVTHLKRLGDSQWYTCWYVSRNGQVTSAGTFQVRDGGSWTFPMTSAADPHDFPTMEITLGSPGKNGELAGPVILSGQTL